MADYNSNSVFQPEIPCHLLTQEDLAFLKAFNIDSEKTNSGKYYLFAEDWCTSAYIEDDDGKDVDLEEDDLIARLQEIIRRSNGEIKWISRETSYTCSKMCPDGFGGSAVFITDDDVRYFGTGYWLEKEIDKFGSAGKTSEIKLTSAYVLLSEILEAFPQADEENEEYDTGIDGSFAVDFITDIVPRIKALLKAKPPILAIVMDGGRIDNIVSDHPELIPPITVMDIEYHPQGEDEEDILRVPQGDGKDAEAVGALHPITKAGIGLAEVSEQLKKRGW